MKIIRAQVLGYCMGVRRAAEAVETALSHKGALPVYTFGPLIHNNTVLKSLEARGVHILDDSQLFSPAGKNNECIQGISVIRAHGIPPEKKIALEKAGYTIVDATCPRVLSSQKLVATYSARGYRIIIAGDKNHGEVAGIAGCVHPSKNGKINCIVVENEKDAEALAPFEGPAVLLGQTTITREEYELISKKILAVNPGITVLQTICPATLERQKALEKLCAEVDGVLVVGGKNSANTTRLFKSAEKFCPKAALIESAREIPESFFSLNRVGISAGASTPDSVIQQVEKVLLGD